MQKIKKSFNTGNLVTVISAILMLIASFLPFVADRYRSYNYVDINDLIDEELFSIFFYCSLIGAVVIAFFSALRINWACILCSFLLLIPNGITIAICVIAVADVGGSANLGIGFYIFAVATLAMVIFSIVGAVKGKKEMRALPMNGGVPQYQAGPQYQAQPQYQPQYRQAQPQYQPQYQQVQPQYQQVQPQYQQAQPQYQQAQLQYQQVQPQYQQAQPQYQQAQAGETGADSAFTTPAE